MKEQVDYYQAKLRFEIDAADVAELLEQGAKVIVVDARKREAYEQEHIPGAIHLPHRELTPERIQMLDRQSAYVVYCDGIGCNASTRGALKMAMLGFSVKELTGGLAWWKRDGYTTEGRLSVTGKETGCSC